MGLKKLSLDEVIGLCQLCYSSRSTLFKQTLNSFEGKGFLVQHNSRTVMLSIFVGLLDNYV